VACGLRPDLLGPAGGRTRCWPLPQLVLLLGLSPAGRLALGVQAPAADWMPSRRHM
jgi:hypothetical protein